MDIWAWAGRRRGTEGEVEKRSADEGQEAVQMCVQRVLNREVAANPAPWGSGATLSHEPSWSE